MSNDTSLDKKSSPESAVASEKVPSKVLSVATACILLATAVVVLKTGYDFVGTVTEIQYTVAPASNLPSEADGAFYFIEPSNIAAS